MSKIICDVCGTAYPDTATQCPICGTAKSDTAKSVSQNPVGEESQDYAYVKGGRFSHSNVKKRNANQDLPRTQAPAKQPKQEQEQEEVVRPVRRRKDEEEQQGNNLGLIIIVVLLVLGIIAACAYVAIRFIDDGASDPTVPGTSQTTNPSNTQPTQPKLIPCTGLQFAVKNHTFTKVGETLLLSAKAVPENTTDKISYATSDANIATVDSAGKVVAVANGEVTITITCGKIQETVKITCNVGVDPTYPTEPPATTQPTQPEYPDYVLKVYDPYGKLDVTLNGYGSKHDFYYREAGAPPREDIIWTSDDETIVSIENGVATALKTGTTRIHAEYNGQKITVIVRCNNANKPEDPLYEILTPYGTKHDVTIYVGDTLSLRLIEIESGRNVPVENLTFTVQNEIILSVDEKGRVTALDVSFGGVYVYAEYEGVTYKILIRVYPRPEN